MSGSSSRRRPETRSQTQQKLIERRKQSVQHRYVHFLTRNPESVNLSRYIDNSCTVCDPADEIYFDDYNRAVYELSQFDPQLTISRENQLTYYRYQAGQSTANLVKFLRSLTFWKIPASFTVFAKSITEQNYDATVGHLPELTEEETETYHQEVDDAWISPTHTVQLFQSNYPATPEHQSFTPLRQQIVQGSQLRRQFRDLIEAAQDENDQSEPESLFVRTRESIDPTNPEDLVQLEQARQEFEEELTVHNQPNTADLFDNFHDSEDETEIVGKDKQKEKQPEELPTPEAEQPEIEFLQLPVPQNLIVPQVQPIANPNHAPHPNPAPNPNPVPNPIQNDPMARNADYPVFDGVRPASWIQAIEIAFAANNVADNRKVAIAAAHLGKYVDWYAGEPPFTHWTEGNGGQDRNFKEIFLAHFQGPEEREGALAQMWRRKQRPRESIVEYVNALNQMWKATGIEIPVEIQMSQFIAGLDTSIQNHVKAQNPQNLGEAVAASKRVYHGSSHASYLTIEEENPIC